MARSYATRELKEKIEEHLLNILVGSISHRKNPEKYPSDAVINMMEKEALIILKELRYKIVCIGNYKWSFDDEGGIVEHVWKGEQE